MAANQLSTALERNKALARRVVEEVWNQGNLAALDDLFEPGARSTDSDRHGRDTQRMKLAVRLYRAVAPDLHISVDQVLADGDAVMIRWTARGTHSGAAAHGVATADVLGHSSGGFHLQLLTTIRPDGHQLIFDGAALFQIANARIASVWMLIDEVEVLRQLNALPAPGPDN